MKSKKKGFTLIELLAVIIILGVLMLIAIPSVTEYISNSRKKAYIATAEQYIGATAIKVNSLDLPISNPDTTYYVPISCINLEKGGKSPYGEWTDAYVVVTFDGTKYDYYWTSLDTTGNGVLLTYGNNLNNDSISTSVENIDLTVGVGGRNNIVLFDTDGSILATSSASSTIADGSSLSGGTLASATDVSCFEYQFIDETYLIDRFGISDIEVIEGWLESDLNVPTSSILGNIVITDYNQFMADGTTECPTDVVIPSKIEGKNVVWIGYNAFGGTISGTDANGHIGKIERLNNTIVPVANYADPLTSIVLPITLIYIDDESFADNNLTNLTIQSAIKYIGYNAFIHNQIVSLTIPGTVNVIGNGAFESNELTSLTLQNGIESIGYGAFKYNYLTTVTIPGSIVVINSDTFYSNNLTSVTLSEGLERIESGAFEDNNISTVTLPSSFTFLCNGAFDATINVLPSTPTWASGCCGCPQ